MDFDNKHRTRKQVIIFFYTCQTLPFRKSQTFDEMPENYDFTIYIYVDKQYHSAKGIYITSQICFRFMQRLLACI